MTASDVPNATTRRQSARVWPRVAGRHSSISMAAAMPTRTSTVPAGPASSKRVAASAAPNCTEPTATATRRIARGAKRPVTISGMRELPLACSLDAPALAERLAEMRAVGRESLIAADPGGELRFRASPGVRQRIERIVAAEAECCAFLRLTLSEHDGELRLAVSAPEGAEPVAAGLVEAFAGRIGK